MSLTWKIGDLARRTQLSVRTLHHYDQIGLLSPSVRTEGGHRLYTEADIARLQRILSLRQLGFSLEEIGRCLEQPEYALGPLIALHKERLQAQMAMQLQLMQRLTALDKQVQGMNGIPVSHLLETMEAIIMLDKYLTPEQIQFLQTSRLADPDRTHWHAFLGKLRAHMQAGDAPKSEPVQQLAQEWVKLSKENTGGNTALGEGLQRMLLAEPEVRKRAGLDEDLWSYLQEAFKP